MSIYTIDTKKVRVKVRRRKNLTTTDDIQSISGVITNQGFTVINTHNPIIQANDQSASIVFSSAAVYQLVQGAYAEYNINVKAHLIESRAPFSYIQRINKYINSVGEENLVDEDGFFRNAFYETVFNVYNEVKALSLITDADYINSIQNLSLPLEIVAVKSNSDVVVGEQEINFSSGTTVSEFFEQPTVQLLGFDSYDVSLPGLLANEIPRFFLYTGERFQKINVTISGGGNPVFTNLAFYNVTSVTLDTPINKI